MANESEVLPVFGNNGNQREFDFADNNEDQQKNQEENDDEDDQLVIYTTQRGHESCRFKGYAYRISSLTAEMKRWRCRREGCKGKLWTTSANTDPEERDTHCHAPFDYTRKRRYDDDDGGQFDQQTDQSIISNALLSSISRKRSSYALAGLRLPNEDDTADAPPLHLLASTFQINLDQEEFAGLGGSREIDQPEYGNQASNGTGNFNQHDDTSNTLVHSSKRAASSKRKREIGSSISKEQQQQQDLVDKAEIVLALMGTRATSDGRRLELFLGDMVEKLASIKDALDGDDHNRLRGVVGQFMEIPVLLNQMVDVHVKQRQQQKKRRIVADVLKRMLPANFAGDKAPFRFEPEAASTSSLTSDELDNNSGTPSW